MCCPPKTLFMVMFFSLARNALIIDQSHNLFEKVLRMSLGYCRKSINVTARREWID